MAQIGAEVRTRVSSPRIHHLATKVLGSIQHFPTSLFFNFAFSVQKTETFTNLFANAGIQTVDLYSREGSLCPLHTTALSNLLAMSIQSSILFC